MATRGEDIYCPKSDEGVKSAVKQGCLVVGLGKAAIPVADKLRSTLAHRARSGDNWEESRTNHLVVVVECMSTGAECEAAAKFMRQVRGSDGYGTYSQIIKRRVAVLALGKAGKVAGASKVEDNTIKRGGCTRMLPIGRMDPGSNVVALPWTHDLCTAMDALMDPPPSIAPAAASTAQVAPAAQPVTQPQAAQPPAVTAESVAAAPPARKPVIEDGRRPATGVPFLVAMAVAVVVIGVHVATRSRSNKA